MTSTHHLTLQNKEGDTVSVANLAELPSDEEIEEIASMGPEFSPIVGEIDEDIDQRLDLHNIKVDCTAQLCQIYAP